MRRIFALLSWASLAVSAAAFVASPWARAALLALQYTDPFSISQYRLAYLRPQEYAQYAQEAIAENDVEDARAIAELAEENGVELPVEILEQIDRLENEWILNNWFSFGKGFIQGSVNNGWEVAGSVASDLVVVGDIRDASVNGYAFVTGGDFDLAVLALSGVGIITTATYVAPVPGLQAAEVGASAFKTSIKLSRTAFARGQVLTSGLLRQVVATAGQAIDLDAARKVFSSTQITAMIKMPSFSQARQVFSQFRERSPMEMSPDEIRKALDGLSPVDTKQFAEAVKEIYRPGGLDPLMDMISSVSDVASTLGMKAAIGVISASDTLADVQRFQKLAAKAGKRTTAIVRMFGKKAIRLGKLIWTVIAALMSVVGWLAWAVWLTFRTLRTAVRLARRVARA